MFNHDTFSIFDNLQHSFDTQFVKNGNALPGTHWSMLQSCARIIKCNTLVEYFCSLHSTFKDRSHTGDIKVDEDIKNSEWASDGVITCLQYNPDQ